MVFLCLCSLLMETKMYFNCKKGPIAGGRIRGLRLIPSLLELFQSCYDDMHSCAKPHSMIVIYGGGQESWRLVARQQ